MSLTPDPKPNRRRYWANLTLAAVAAQVGCLTLVLLLAAVLGGLWLDARFQTRPVITIVLVIASIPISLISMLLIVRSATNQIKTNIQQEREEEANIGRKT